VVVVAVLMWSRSNTPFVPDRVAVLVLSLIAVLVLSWFPALRWSAVLSRSQ
jgi:hypothetical protein